MADRNPDDVAREEEAKRALERVARESEVLGQSTFARTVNRARAHMSAADADPDDPVEVWGRRTGRALGLIAFIGLAVWLISYLMR